MANSPNGPTQLNMDSIRTTWLSVNPDLRNDTKSAIDSAGCRIYTQG